MAPEVVTLAPGFVVSRIAKGNWQLAERHGAPYAREAAIEDMRRFVEAGITLFDCADHDDGVGQMVGEFRLRHPDHARRLRVSTKLVPDLESLPRLRRRDVQHIVDTSLARLGQERLDLVQFHWWDYRVPGYVEAMHWLHDLKSAGKVELIGTTNFDTARLSEIVASRYVLNKPGVAGAIVGARNAAYLDDLVQAVTLDDGDRAAVARIVSQATGPRGDCYELERVEEGPHSMIMWKNQNSGGAPADGRYADAPPAAERESR